MARLDLIAAVAVAIAVVWIFSAGSGPSQAPMGDSYYDLLSIKPGQPTKVIKRAYRVAAAKTHPDRFQNKEQKAKAEVQFMRLVKGYEILLDPQKRNLYDKMLTVGLVDYDVKLYKKVMAKQRGLDEDVYDAGEENLDDGRYGDLVFDDREQPSGDDTFDVADSGHMLIWGLLGTLLLCVAPIVYGMQSQKTLSVAQLVKSKQGDSLSTDASAIEREIEENKRRQREFAIAENERLEAIETRKQDIIQRRKAAQKEAKRRAAGGSKTSKKNKNDKNEDNEEDSNGKRRAQKWSRSELKALEKAYDALGATGPLLFKGSSVTHSDEVTGLVDYFHELTADINGTRSRKDILSNALRVQASKAASSRNNKKKNARATSPEPTRSASSSTRGPPGFENADVEAKTPSDMGDDEWLTVGDVDVDSKSSSSSSSKKNKKKKAKQANKKSEETQAKSSSKSSSSSSSSESWDAPSFPTSQSQSKSQAHAQAEAEKKPLNPSAMPFDPSLLWTATQVKDFEGALQEHSELPQNKKSQKWVFVASKVAGKSPKECEKRFQTIRQELLRQKNVYGI